MFNKKRLDNIFYPIMAIVAVLALFLVGFQAGGEMTMDNVEAERAAAEERAAESDADTEATGEGSEEEASETEETDADTEATEDGAAEEETESTEEESTETDADTEASEDGDW